MTPKQQGRYLHGWWAACDANGWSHGDEPRRHQEVSRALVAVFGPARRHKRFSNFDDDDFTVADRHWQNLAHQKPFDAEDLKTALREDRIRRMRYVIEEMKKKYGSGKVIEILGDKFDSILLEELSFEDVQKLLYTINARLHEYRTYQRRKPKPTEETCQLPSPQQTHQ